MDGLNSMSNSIKVHVRFNAKSIVDIFTRLTEVLALFTTGDWSSEKKEEGNTISARLILDGKLALDLGPLEKKSIPETVEINPVIIGPILPAEISEIVIRTRIEFILALHS